MCLSVIGVETDRLIEIFQSLWQHILFRQGDGEIVIGRRPTRLAANHGLEFRHGLVESLHSCENYAKAISGFGVLGLQVQKATVRGRRLVPYFLIYQR